MLCGSVLLISLCLKFETLKTHYCDAHDISKSLNDDLIKGRNFTIRNSTCVINLIQNCYFSSEIGLFFSCTSDFELESALLYLIAIVSVILAF